MNNTKFIAGPCVIESYELLDEVAREIVAINRNLGVDIIFKASFIEQCDDTSKLKAVVSAAKGL